MGERTLRSSTEKRIRDLRFRIWLCFMLSLGFDRAIICKHCIGADVSKIIAALPAISQLVGQPVVAFLVVIGGPRVGSSREPRVAMVVGRHTVVSLLKLR